MVDALQEVNELRYLTQSAARWSSPSSPSVNSSMGSSYTALQSAGSQKGLLSGVIEKWKFTEDREYFTSAASGVFFGLLLAATIVSASIYIQRKRVQQSKLSK